MRSLFHRLGKLTLRISAVSAAAGFAAFVAERIGELKGGKNGSGHKLCGISKDSLSAPWIALSAQGL